MRLYANAKINLTLDVTGIRPDGYHEVSMIMQSVDLADILDIEKNTGDSIILTCDNNDLPCDEHNLIIRAARALMEGVGRSDGLNIRLNKNIPMAAGLAGGSADAAAALVGINELCGYGLSVEELKNIGAGIGADIPFCIQGGTCLAEGIGEKLTRISPLPDCYIVLVKPPFDVSTAYVYKNLDPLLGGDITHPDTKGMISLIDNGDIDIIAGRLGNILETVTASGYPEITYIKKRLTDSGAAGVLMSGSGPTVYGIFTDEQAAMSACAGLKGIVPAFGNDASGFEPTSYRQVFMCRPAKEGVRISES